MRANDKNHPTYMQGYYIFLLEGKYAINTESINITLRLLDYGIACCSLCLWAHLIVFYQVCFILQCSVLT